MRRSRGRPAHDDILTPAEWRVAEALRHGMTNRLIAERQKVSLDAVKFHIANILAKLQMTDRRALRRWSGVDRHSALHQRERTAMPTQLGPLGQIARSVRDIISAEAWYRDVLGLPHLYTFGHLAFFDCGGVRLMLQQGDGAADSVLYFRVDDIHAAKADLEARGAHFPHAPHRIHTHADGTEEWMAFLEENEKRLIGVMTQVRPASAATSASPTTD